MDTLDKNTVYFVCTGNTCRSPMAEHLLRHGLNAENGPLSQLKVASFGVSAFSGQSASPNSIAAMARVGIDLKLHLSRSGSDVPHEKALAYFCMTQSHQQSLIHYFDVDPNAVFLVREWVETPPGDIPDPFGMNEANYIHCRDSIVEAIPSIIMNLKRLIG